MTRKETQLHLSLVKFGPSNCDLDVFNNDAASFPMTSRLPRISEELELIEIGREPRTESLPGCGPRNDTLRFIAWGIFSSLSAQYAKYILVDKNFHYPFFLINRVYLLVLGAGLLRNGARVAWSDKWSKRQKHQPWRRWAARFARAHRGASNSWDRILLHGAAALSALSVLFWFQAIIHFENLTTLIFISSWVSLFDVADIPRLSRGSAAYRRWNQPIQLLCLGLALILLDEYRIQVTGLLFSAISLLSLLASRALRRHANFRAHQQCSVSATCRSRDGFLTLQTIYLIVPSLLMEYLTESKASGLRRSRVTGFTCFWFTVFTLIPLLLEQSVIAPSSNTSLRMFHRARTAITSRRTAWTNLLRAGFLFTMPSDRARRAHSSFIQTFLFMIVVLICLFMIPGPDKRHRLLRERDTEEDTLDYEPRAKNEEEQPFKRVVKYLPAILITISWSLFLMVNFGLLPLDTRSRPLPVELDTTYQPPNDVEIVISAYKEPLEPLLELLAELRQLPGLTKARVHYYTKNPDASEGTIRASIGGSKVSVLENVGREGHTYLHHIVNNWDSLARHTVFMQAGVHNTREFLPRIRDYFDPERTGFLPLGFSGNVCPCGDCGDRWGWFDDTGLIERVFLEAYDTPCVLGRDLLARDALDVDWGATGRLLSVSAKNLLSGSPTVKNLVGSDPDLVRNKERQLLLTYKGQFVASAARIRGLPRAVYSDLVWAFEDPRSWAHLKDYLSDAGSHNEVSYLDEHPPSAADLKASLEQDTIEYPKSLDRLDAPMLGYSLERLWGVLMRCGDASPGGEAEHMAWQCPSLQSGALGRLWFGKKACQCFDE